MATTNAYKSLSLNGSSLAKTDSVHFDYIKMDSVYLVNVNLFESITYEHAKDIIFRLKHYAINNFGNKFFFDYGNSRILLKVHQAQLNHDAIREHYDKSESQYLCSCDLGLFSDLLKMRNKSCETKLSTRIASFMSKRNKHVNIGYCEVNFYGFLHQGIEYLYGIIFDNMYSLKKRALAFSILEILIDFYFVVKYLNVVSCNHIPNNHSTDLTGYSFLGSIFKAEEFLHSSVQKRAERERLTMLFNTECVISESNELNSFLSSSTTDNNVQYEAQMFTNPFTAVNDIVTNATNIEGNINHHMDPKLLVLLEELLKNGISIDADFKSQDFKEGMTGNKKVDINISPLSIITQLGPIVVPVIGIGIYILYQKGMISKEVIMLGGALAGIKYYKEILEFFNTINDWRKSYQSNGPGDTLVSLVVKSILSTLAISTVLKGKLFAFFFQAKDFDRVRTGTENIIHFILETCQTFINWLCDTIKIKPYLFYEGKTPELTKVLLEVREFLDEVSGSLVIDHVQAKKLIGIVKILQDFQILQGVDRVDKERIAAALIALSVYRRKLEEGNWKGHSARPEPFAIFFAGPSQIGKTSAMHAIKYAILVDYLPKDKYERSKNDLDTEVYNWNPTETYRDNYAQQAICLIDDVGSRKDIPGVASEWNDFLQMKNCMPFCLVSAHLDNKGSQYFNSAFIMATTNLTRIDANSMYSADPIIRRMDLVLDSEAKSEYCIPGTNRFDKDRFGHEEGFKHINYYIARYPGPSMPLERLSGPYSLDQIVPIIKDRAIQAHKRALKVMRDQQMYAENAIKSRDERESDNGMYESQAGIIVAHPLKNDLLPKFTDTYDIPRIPGAMSLNLINILGCSALLCYCSIKMGQKLPDIMAKTQHFLDSCQHGAKGIATQKLLMKMFPEAFPLGAIMPKTAYELARAAYDNNEFCYEDKYLAYNVDLEQFNTFEKFSEAFLNKVPSLIVIAIKNPFSSSKGWDKLDLSPDMHRCCEGCPYCTDELVWNGESATPEFTALMAFGYAPDFENYTSSSTLNIISDSDDFKTAFLDLEKQLESIPYLYRPCPNDKFFFGYLSDMVKKMLVDLNEETAIALAFGIILRRYLTLLKDRKKQVGTRFRQLMSTINYSILDKISTSLYRAKTVLVFLVPISLMWGSSILMGKVYEKALEVGHGLCYDRVFVDKRQDFLSDAPPNSKRKPAFTADDICSEATPNSTSGIRTMKTQSPVSNSASGMRMRTIGKPISNGIETYLPFSHKGDYNVAQVTKAIYKHNMYMIYFGDKRIGQLLMFDDNLGLIMHHYYDLWQNAITDGVLTKENPLELIKFGDPARIKYRWYPDINHFIEPGFWHGKDMLIVELPRGTIPIARSIIDKFISKSSSKNKYSAGFNSSLYVINSDYGLDSFNMSSVPSNCPEYNTVTEYYNGKVWCYGAATVRGDCGNLLVVNDNRANGSVIAGLHMVGSSTPGHGFAFPIYSDDLETILRLLGRQKKVMIEEFEPQFVGNAISPDHMIVGKGECKQSQSKSKINRSPLFGKMGKVKFFPAKLRVFKGLNGVEIDPLSKAISKYRPIDSNMDLDLINLVSQVTSNYIYQHSISETLRENNVLDFEEGCHGIIGDCYARALRRSKSSGWPWNMDVPPGYRGKQHIFGVQDEFEFNGKYALKVRDRVEYIIENAKKNIRIVAVCTLNPKDEVIEYDKMIDGKVRLFFGYPVDHLIVDRMFNLTYRRFMMLNRIRNSSCIGINVYSYDWDNLVRHLTFNCADFVDMQICIAGDHSAFDGRIPFNFSMNYTEHKNAFYNDEHGALRAVLDMNIYDSYQIFDGVITKFFGCHPSGGPDTASRNTKINLDYIMYAVLLIMFPPEGHLPLPNCNVNQARMLIEDFFLNSRHAVFGDDHVTTINPISTYYGVVTQQTLTSAFALMGLKYTDDNKGSDEHVYRSIRDVSFLKRKFSYDNKRNRWIAPLELDSIQKSLDWISDTATAYLDFKNTINSAIMEYSLHDEEIYYRFANKVCKISSEVMGFSPTRYSWEVAREKCLAIEEIL